MELLVDSEEDVHTSVDIGALSHFEPAASFTEPPGIIIIVCILDTWILRFYHDVLYLLQQVFENVIRLKYNVFENLQDLLQEVKWRDLNKMKVIDYFILFPLFAYHVHVLCAIFIATSSMASSQKKQKGVGYQGEG